MVKGSNSYCLTADVIPLEFHATSQTDAQHKGKEWPMVCKILATHWGANSDGEIRLHICIPQTGEGSDMDTLIDSIFPALSANK